MVEVMTLRNCIAPKLLACPIKILQKFRKIGKSKGQIAKALALALALQALEVPFQRELSKGPISSC